MTIKGGTNVPTIHKLILTEVPLRQDCYFMNCRLGGLIQAITMGENQQLQPVCNPQFSIYGCKMMANSRFT